MNTDMMRCALLGILISFLSLYSLVAQAQTDGGDSTDDVSDLDLFDDDAELTESGWIQFYASAGYMYLDGDGKFFARLPSGNEVTIINFSGPMAFLRFSF